MTWRNFFLAGSAAAESWRPVHGALTGSVADDYFGDDPDLHGTRAIHAEYIIFIGLAVSATSVADEAAQILLTLGHGRRKRGKAR